MKNRAFTLIELLVVVLIIGILAAVALPQYEKAVEKSRATQVYTLMATLAEAEQVYYLANGEWTGDYSKLDIGFPYDSGDDEVRDFSGGDYNWHKCGGDGCVYTYRPYKDGVYGLQVYFDDKSFVCMASENTEAEKLCATLGFSSYFTSAGLGETFGSRVNYYKQP